MKSFVRKTFLVMLMTVMSLIAVDACANTGIVSHLVEQAKAHPTELAGSGMIAMAGAAVVVNSETVSKLWVVTQTEFDALQAKYRHLYLVDVNFSDAEKYQYVVRRPTRAVIEAVTSNSENPFKVADLMISNMIVAGDVDALDDGVLFNRVVEQLTGIVKDGSGAFTNA